MKPFLSIFVVIKSILQQPLNRGRRLKSLINFVKWQIAARLIKKSIVVPWVNDARLIVGAGQAGLTGNLYSGFMEYEDMVFLLHALQKFETFVDVGANAGAYTVLASKVVGSPSIAFEPISETAEILIDQLQVNQIETIVSLKNIGIGDQKGIVSFINDSGTMNRVSLPHERENITKVRISTLDTELVHGNRYFFKIDVEGYEYNVIEGAANLLSSDNVSAIIIELNGSGDKFSYSNEDVNKKLLSYGFVPITYEPKNREIKQLDDNKIRNAGNTIYVKDINTMQERCKAAPSRTVHTAAGLEI